MVEVTPRPPSLLPPLPRDDFRFYDECAEHLLGWRERQRACGCAVGGGDLSGRAKAGKTSLLTDIWTAEPD